MLASVEPSVLLCYLLLVICYLNILMPTVKIKAVDFR